MIDIENKLYTVVKSKMPSDINMDSMYSNSSKLPLCTLVVMDNSVYESFINSARIENAASIMVEVNAYSNKIAGKKEECKKIIKTADDEHFVNLRLTWKMQQFIELLLVIEQSLIKT